MHNHLNVRNDKTMFCFPISGKSLAFRAWPKRIEWIYELRYIKQKPQGALELYAAVMWPKFAIGPSIHSIIHHSNK